MHATDNLPVVFNKKKNKNIITVCTRDEKLIIRVANISYTVLLNVQG